MSLREMLLEVFAWIEAVEQDLGSGLSAGDRARVGSVDHWSPKDIICHVTAWRQVMLQSFQTRERISTARTAEELQPVNASLFEAYRNLPWPEVEEFARQARRGLRGLIAEAGEAELTAPGHFPWLEGQILWRRIVGDLVLHPLTHFAQLLSDLGRKQEALELQVEAASRLLALDPDPIWQGLTRYNLACAYALAGRKELAIADLRQALRLQPGLTEWSKADPDFESIRGDADFQAVYSD